MVATVHQSKCCPLRMAHHAFHSLHSPCLPFGNLSISKAVEAFNVMWLVHACTIHSYHHLHGIPFPTIIRQSKYIARSYIAKGSHLSKYLSSPMWCIVSTYVAGRHPQGAACHFDWRQNSSRPLNSVRHCIWHCRSPFPAPCQMFYVHAIISQSSKAAF